ncbi:MAG: hypothetical protein WC477_02790 [Patescibacteria group bacterium]
MSRLIFLNILFLFVAGALFMRVDVFELKLDQMMAEVLGGMGILTLVCIIGGVISFWFFNPDEGIIVPTISLAFLSLISTIFWFVAIGDSHSGFLRAIVLIPSLPILAFVVTRAATGLQTIEYKTRWSFIPFAVTALAFGPSFHLPSYKWAPCCAGIVLLAVYRICLRYIDYENIGSYSASPTYVDSDGGPSAIDYMSSRGR